MANTDGKFWAYKQVAALPDHTGMFRCSIIRFSELYDWSESALEETIQRERRGFPMKLLGPLSRSEYDEMQCIGYCMTSDAEAPIEYRDWRSLPF